MLIFIFYLFLFLLAKPIWASEVISYQTLFATEFNNPLELKNWQVVRNQQYFHPELPCFNGGNPAQWEIVDGKLGITINGSPCATELIPSNLDLSEVDNYEFEFEWFFFDSAHMDRNVLLQWQDAANWYGLHIVDNKIILQKIIAGNLASLYNNWGFFQFEANQSYLFKISVVNDLITLWINNEQIFQIQDRPPYINGYKTVGLQASSGDVFRSVSFFDNLKVTSLDEVGEKKLAVPLYKQTDPDWKNQEYDQASKWATTGTSLQRWGCALTAATMILDYYDIKQLPDGNKLNPGKLNAWLKNQPDGYIGEGLVNWLAISRLSNLMSQKLETPILEYKKLANNLEAAVAEIDQDRPLILQIPGHFMVANGYTANKNDLFIKDPAYNFHRFSQHQASLLTLKTYQPSHTDLSYLLLLHDPQIQVTLIDESGQMPVDLDIHTEFIQTPVDEVRAQTKVKIVQSLAQPQSEKYTLKIKTPKTLDNTNEAEETAQVVEIYAYDIQGEVSILSQIINKDSLFELNFNQIQPSQLKEIKNQFTLLRELLKTLYQEKAITTKYAYLKLDQQAAWAELAQTQANQARYISLIFQTAQELREFIPYSTIIRNLAPSN